MSDIPKPSAAELNAAVESFIKKIASLQFSTGKASPLCPVCGTDVGEHLHAGIAVRIELRLARLAREEMAFSA